LGNVLWYFGWFLFDSAWLLFRKIEMIEIPWEMYYGILVGSFLILLGYFLERLK